MLIELAKKVLVVEELEKIPPGGRTAL